MPSVLLPNEKVVPGCLTAIVGQVRQGHVLQILRPVRAKVRSILAVAVGMPTLRSPTHEC